MPQFSIGKIMFAGDFTILDLLSMLVYKNIESGLNGLICIFVSSKIVDYLLYMEKGMMLYVVSDKAEERSPQRLWSNIVRGATLFERRGSIFPWSKKVVLYCNPVIISIRV